MKTLRCGDKCPEIVKVKTLLAKQGFWSENQLGQDFTSKLEEAIIYFQQTHLNEQGEPCGVDGTVGPETWWALKHPTGKDQKSNLSSDQIPSGIGDLRTKLLQISIDQHGIKEIPNGSNRGTIPNGGVDKFLPDWVKKPNKKGPAWCCFMVSYVTKEAFGNYPLGRRHGSCAKAWEAAGERNMQRNEPTPGDSFIMLHDNGTGHTGFVYNVSPDNDYFNTIEGNCGNRVKIGKRKISDMVGFINFYGDDLHGDFEHKLVDSTDVGKDGTR